MAGRALLEALKDVPDPRSRHGRSYPLSAILALLVLGILLGRRSLTAICLLTRDYGDAFPLLLGFPRKRIPCLSNLSTLLRRLDVRAFETVLAAWVADNLPRFAESYPLLDPPISPSDASAAAASAATAEEQAEAAADPVVIHLDGKTLRGSCRKTPADAAASPLPGVHLLSAFESRAGAVLAQIQVDAKTNEHKAALQLLGILPRAAAAAPPSPRQQPEDAPPPAAPQEAGVAM
jgi:hypothetical protein